MLSLYFLPAIIALSRHHQSGAAIAVLNLLLGWTVIESIRAGLVAQRGLAARRRTSTSRVTAITWDAALGPRARRLGSSVGAGAIFGH